MAKAGATICSIFRSFLLVLVMELHPDGELEVGDGDEEVPVEDEERLSTTEISDCEWVLF